MKKLKREVQSVAKPYMKQIDELNLKTKNKEASLQAVQKEIEAKQKTADDLEATAKAALEDGGDPVAVLQKAATLKNEAESLNAFLVDSADYAATEQKEIERLKNEMITAVRDAVSGSATMENKKQQFKDALAQVVSVVDDWNQAVKEIYFDLGLSPVKHQLLMFEDGSEERELSVRVGNLTHPHQHILC